MARKKKRKTSRRGRKRAPLAALSQLSTSEIQEELERRELQIDELRARREELQSELESVENEIDQLGGAPRRGPGRPRKKTGRRGRPPGRAGSKKTTRKKTTRRRGRPRGRRTGKSLADTLQEVLQGKTMSVSEATDAVTKAGYKSSSPNLRTMVNQQLLSNPDRFRKVARGRYTTK